MVVDLLEADYRIKIYVGILAETPVMTGFDNWRRTHIRALLKAVRYIFVFTSA